MKYYTDGWVKGHNPSKWGGGYTVVDENNNLIKYIDIEKVGFTNNEGETLGILEGLRVAGVGDSVSTDSMCCLGWANRGFSKARPDLNELLRECRQLMRKKKINLLWEGREFNLAGIYNERDQEIRRDKRKALSDVSIS